RAEFTKIIVAAFGFEDTEGDVSFTDVSDDDWYSEFVKIAVKNGLVQGYPEGDFKPNATITREEMATILVRAFKSMGIDVETGDVDFADSDEIGDWAAEYVATLAKLGIVQGRGDNMFVPKDNLTRAEAAVVIYKSIMQLFENQ
ncbi:MAG: S-layer homology domain-containing protein, partial [Eubacteriales bacterium]|nr:S-layer homology domain-containing protein [Eubacteriales bacterium]